MSRVDVASASVSSEPHRWERMMMARLMAGDDSALAAVYDEYAPIVHGIARRTVGAGDAVDVCQEVFVALWEHPERFDPARGSLRTFLAMITRRRCIDLLRGSGRRRAREDRTGTDPSSWSAVAVDDEAVAIMAAERVRDALSCLPDEQRRAVELAYFEGHTYREVATVMGIPEGTAKSRMRMAMQRLSGELEGWGRGEEGPSWP